MKLKNVFFCMLILVLAFNTIYSEEFESIRDEKVASLENHINNIDYEMVSSNQNSWASVVVKMRTPSNSSTTQFWGNGIVYSNYLGNKRK